MNIVDIIIIAMLVMGMLVGFVRGFFKQTVSFVGTILVIISAYILKSPLSLILYKKLPFIEFGGILKGLSALNILMYEILAFIIVFVVLSIALTILIKASGLVEKLLKATVILAIPSKLLGMAVGFIQALFVVYIALFVLSLPMINIKYIDGSKYATMVLTKTPIIPKYTNDALDKYEEIRVFVNENVNLTISNDEKNSNLVDIMLKNKMVDIENIKYLNNKGKIKIKNIDELIDKYKEE